MTMETSAQSIKESYKLLLTRKQALEDMVAAADRVERLHSGLQAAVQAGKPTNMISKSALHYFEGLSEHIRVQPTHKVRTMLRQLEARMAANLQMVMEHADRELTEFSDGSVMDEVNDLINDFRRTSWTAVSLRILLSERGEMTNPTALPVEQEKLRQKASQMAEQEKQCRTKVSNDIEQIRTDAEQILQSPHLPEPMRDMLKMTVKQMETNKAHIKSGKSLESLPFPIEVIEMGMGHVDDISMDVPPPPEQDAAEEKKGGFVQHLDSWLNTPWNVSWDEAKKKPPK